MIFLKLIADTAPPPTYSLGYNHFPSLPHLIHHPNAPFIPGIDLSFASSHPASSLTLFLPANVPLLQSV